MTFKDAFALMGKDESFRATVRYEYAFDLERGVLSGRV
jgi:hypothetical protein